LAAQQVQEAVAEEVWHKKIIKQYIINQFTTIQTQKELTAILIFSRHAKEEAGQKKYANLSSKKSGIKLASQLIRYTQQQAEESALPVIHFFTDKQRGHTFGERLADAIEEGFALGFNKLIVTGTDSPCVHNKQFIEVANKLNKTQLVLAPTADGGVYLIGIHKDAFDKESFIEVPWLTNTVFNSLKHYASQHHFSLIAEITGDDLDNVSDVFQWKQKHHCSWFTLFISQLIFSVKSINYQQYQVTFYFNDNIYSSLLRGPPQYHY